MAPPKILIKRNFSFTNSLKFLDTYKIILQLERSGLTRHQSVEILRTFNIILSDREAKLKQNHISNDLDFSTKESLSQLRAEIGSLRKTEISSLSSTKQIMQRELDLLGLKFREDFNNLKSDTQISTSLYKSEQKEEKQKNDLSIQDLGHKLSIASGELKNSIDKVKLEIITKYTGGIVLSASIITVFLIKLL